MPGGALPSHDLSHELTMLPRALKPHFVSAVRRVLRPIVRQVISFGLHYQAFDRIVREVFLDVAETDFALPFKRQTDSRLALVTGLNRKEISLLRERKADKSAPADVEDSLLTHLIGRWMAGPPYASPDGAARRLPYDSDNPKAASFARLAREVVGVDLPVRSILDELLRTRAAEMLTNGDVVLRQEANLPPVGTEAKLALLGVDKGLHADKYVIEKFCRIGASAWRPLQFLDQTIVCADAAGKCGQKCRQPVAHHQRVGRERALQLTALARFVVHETNEIHRHVRPLRQRLTAILCLRKTAAVFAKNRVNCFT